MDKKKAVDDLYYLFKKGGYNCLSIHGDKSQNERNSVMDKFKTGKVPILIATDVIGRGIDFPNVSYIFNYDTPKNLDDYIHRIGRTGRCGNKGKAISFLNDSCKPIINDLYHLLKKHNITIPDFMNNMYLENKKGFGYGNSSSNNYGGGNYYNKYGNNNSNNNGFGGFKTNNGFGGNNSNNFENKTNNNNGFDNNNNNSNSYNNNHNSFKFTGNNNNNNGYGKTFNNNNNNNGFNDEKVISYEKNNYTNNNNGNDKMSWRK